MTLIEILVVVTIFGILAAFAAPSLKGMNDKNKLRATARELVALARTGRAEAVFGARDTTLFIDAEKHEFWLDLRTPDKKTGEVDPKRKKTQVEERRKAQPGIVFDEVAALAENVVKGKLVAVDFHKDGTASPTMICVRNRAEARLTVEVVRSTGFAEVASGSVEERRAFREKEAQAAPPPPTAGGGRSGAI